MEPEWNINPKDNDAAILGLKNNPIKEKIKMYVDTMGWTVILQSLIELADDAFDDDDASWKNKVIHGLEISYEAYMDRNND